MKSYMSRANPDQNAVLQRLAAALRLAAVELQNGGPEVEPELLRMLPVTFGYTSAVDFLWAFRSANGLRTRKTILTPRKVQALIKRTLAGEGRHEIAAALGVSPQTVSNMRVRLGLNPRSLRQA